MTNRPLKSNKVDSHVLQFGPFYVPEPKGILQEMEEAEEWARRQRGDYHSTNIISDFIGSAFVEILNGILKK